MPLEEAPPPIVINGVEIPHAFAFTYRRRLDQLDEVTIEAWVTDEPQMLDLTDISCDRQVVEIVINDPLNVRPPIRFRAIDVRQEDV